MICVVACLVIKENGCGTGRVSEGNKESKSLSSEKLQTLGWNYRAIEETLADAVQSFKDAALLD